MSNKNLPYNNGKVSIGSAYQPPVRLSYYRREDFEDDSAWRRVSWRTVFFTIIGAVVAFAYVAALLRVING